MAWAKRARIAETPKQPSLSLLSRAPYFYPTRTEICVDVKVTAARGVVVITCSAVGTTWVASKPEA